MKDLAGKVAFVTGGASGLGLAMARSLVAAEMKVVITDVEQKALDKVAADFSEVSSAQVLTLKLDVTDRVAMEAAAQKTESTFGKVHVVCNNAGVRCHGPLDLIGYEDWDWVMGVNIGGVINGVRTFTDRIKSHGEGGHFINTSSMAGHMAIPSMGVYNTTKYAVVGLSETLRSDLAPHNIGVSVLCPGAVLTNFLSAGRNRPKELQSEPNSELRLLRDAADAELSERMDEIIANALDPAVVGDMVVAAIHADDAYIFTHPDLKPMIDARNSLISESFVRWSKYCSDRSIRAEAILNE